MKGDVPMTSHVLQNGTPEDAGMDPARLRRLRELVAGWVTCDDTPSVVALVARRGIVVLHEAFGVLRHGDTTPTLQRDSIFPIASCSKPITAAAVMCLVDDGMIGLNCPFVDYVPEWDLPEVQGLSDATVADLLQHTSGIDDLTVINFAHESGKRWAESPPPVPGRHLMTDKLIRLAAGAPLARPPGTAMLYSNVGYQLLGDIVRRVSYQPLWQFAQSRLFEPLGMRDSQFVLPPSLRERRVYRAPGMPGNQTTHPWMQGTRLRGVGRKRLRIFWCDVDRAGPRCVLPDASEWRLVWRPADPQSGQRRRHDPSSGRHRHSVDLTLDQSDNR